LTPRASTLLTQQPNKRILGPIGRNALLPKILHGSVWQPACPRQARASRDRAYELSQPQVNQFSELAD
ncbi:MAG: hypothetical protein L0312_18960, partial [Acidobacteria bacterium]|nr:hypothetical protein [Acidobacteriota bacterium]